MVSPQKEHGYVALANEIWDILGLVSLSEYELNAIRLVIRLSYGCNQTACIFGAWTDFESCGGIHRSKIGKILRSLESKRIFVIDWQAKAIHFNKHYDTWVVKLRGNRNWDKFANLVRKNIRCRNQIKGYSQQLQVIANGYNLTGTRVIAVGYKGYSQQVQAMGLTGSYSVDLQRPRSKGSKRSSKKEGSPPPPSADADEVDESEGEADLITKLQNLIRKKYPRQITHVPSYNACRRALRDFTLEKLEEAATDARLALKDQSGTGALNEIIDVARRRKEEADGGKGSGYGKDNQGNGRGRGKGDTGSKEGLGEGRWAEANRLLREQD